MKPIKICLLGPGSFFGEYEILNHVCRSFTVRCVSSKVSLFRISKRRFVNYLQEHSLIHEFFVKKATQTHIWQMEQITKIQSNQELLKFHEKFLKVKSFKQFYRYRPIRSSVADIEEAISREPSSKSSKDLSNFFQEKTNTKIEVSSYPQNFFRGKRIICTDLNANNILEEKKSIIKKPKIEMSLGRKIGEIVKNNEKALKLLKKQKNFSEICLSNKLFETDKTKENLKTTKSKRPLSAQFFPKEGSNLFKNETKILSKRPFSSKPYNNSDSKEVINFHVRKKSQNLSIYNNNSSQNLHKRVLSGGFFIQRRNSTGLMGQNIPKTFGGILQVLAIQKSS